MELGRLEALIVPRSLGVSSIRRGDAALKRSTVADDLSLTARSFPGPVVEPADRLADGVAADRPRL